MKHEITDFDPAEYLENGKMIAGYLSDARETGDRAFIDDAINVAERARDMKRVTENAGASRAMGESGVPEFE